jgi:hypothetical protein
VVDGASAISLPRVGRCRRRSYLGPLSARALFVAAALAAALARPSLARAQLPPLAETQAQYLPSSEVPDSGGLKSQVASYDAALNVPIVLGETTFLVPGAQYHVDSVSYSGQPAGFTELNALHSVDFPILLVQLLSETWSLSMRVWPGAASDFGAFDTQALRVGGLALLTWSPPRGRVTLGAGPIVTYAFGEMLPLPLVYVDWKPKPWLRVEASLPAFTNVQVALGQRWELGVQADVNGNEYSIRAPELAERYPCRSSPVDDATTTANETKADPASCLDHLAYSVVTAGAVARLRLFSSVWLGAFFGRTLFRRYDAKNVSGEAVPGGRVALSNELALRVALTFRLPRPEKSQPPQ